MNAPLQTEYSPFHRGEREMQRRIGKQDRMEKIGRTVIRPFMPDQHREFFAQLPFVFLGSVDQDGWPWASILAGQPGFLSSPNDRQLRVQAWPHPDDPLADTLVRDAPLGLLGLELSTRRRNRLNATIGKASETGILLDVTQSFGNCPKYIQTHVVDFIREPGSETEHSKIERFNELDIAARNMITSANALYVASYADSDQGRSVDVSHRGGRSGFVKVQGNSLLVPDFQGNNFFNTLGNFLVTPRAGLLFPDYQTGDVLMLTGKVDVLQEQHPDIAGFDGAQRGWRFELVSGIRIHDALPFRAELTEYSPNSLSMGSWTTEAR